jgi:hypothetical protein
MTARVVARLDIALAALVFGLAFAWFCLSLGRSFELSDEGLILYHSARTAAGELPYRDFPDVYGPGVLTVTGLVLEASGGYILPLRFVLAGSKAMAVALTFLVCRFAVPRPFALLGAAVATAYWGRLSWNLNTPYAAVYTIPLCLLACFALVYALRTDRRSVFVVAGVVGGAAVLFKQTLGLVSAYGMLLAVLAVSALTGPPGERTRAGAVQFVVVWLLAGVVFVLPGWRMLGPRDYLIHFLPIHVFMVLIAMAVARRRRATPILAAVPGRLGPLAVGLAVLPAVTAAFYLAVGQFDALVYNLIDLPSRLVNYYAPVGLPPRARSLLLGGIVTLMSAALLGLRGEWQGMRRVGIAGAVLAAAGAATHSSDVLGTVLGPQRRWPADSRWPVILWTLPTMTEGMLLGGTLLAATLFLAPSFLSRRAEVPSDTLDTVVPVMFLQAALVFQVFPRGSFNVWLVQGAAATLLTIVLYRWYLVGVAPATSLARRLAAGLLVAWLPLWFVAPVVHHLLSSRLHPISQPPAFAEARGIRMSMFDRRVGHIGDMEALVRFLARTEPPDAPLLPISVDMMMMYLSKRPHLFPERDYHFFLLGLEMLPAAERAALADDAVVRRLADTPSALVVIRRDQVSTRMLNALAGLRDALKRDYETLADLGGYSVLRRRDGARDARPVAPPQ